MTGPLLALASRFRFDDPEVPPDDRARLSAAAHELERAAPTPRLADSFDLMDGLWRCLCTTSRHVLGLNRLPMVTLRSVYQRVSIAPGKTEGYSYNIGELVRGSAVKLICGEYARIRASATHEARLDLEYEHFYMAHRIFTSYEGVTALSTSLDDGTLRDAFRLPLKKPGWQRYIYLHRDVRVLYGNHGGLFVMVREDQ